MSAASLSFAAFALVHTVVVSDQNRQCDNLYRDYSALLSLNNMIFSSRVDVAVISSSLSTVADEEPSLTSVFNNNNKIIRAATALGFSVEEIQSKIDELLYAFPRFPLNMEDLLRAPPSTSPLEDALFNYLRSLDGIMDQVQAQIAYLRSLNQTRCRTLMPIGIT